MIEPGVRERIGQLISHEALCLDRRQWDDWAALYAEDAVFWVPAWKDVDTPTEDPDRELSLIYLRGRASLLDRVWRLKSGMSVASETPLRTAHILGAPSIGEDDRGLGANCAWSCHTYHPDTHAASTNFGHYEFKFSASGGALLILTKRVVLLNERVSSLLDVYCV